MTSAFVTAVVRALPGATALEVAEALWLAQFATGAVPPQSTEPAVAGHPPAVDSDGTVPAGTDAAKPGGTATTSEPTAAMYPDTAVLDGDSDVTDALRVGAPRVPALQAPLQMARALRPLRQRVPSRHALMVDEAATAERIAAERLWLPVLHPLPELRFNLAVIADAAPSMLVWDRTLHEFHLLLQQVGAFRTISRYTIDTERGDPVRPPSLHAAGISTDKPLNPATIIDPTGRLLILVVTDGVGTAWHDGRMDHLAQRWASVNHLQIVCVLPRRLWRGTGLRTTFQRVAPHSRRERVPVPVAELSADGLKRQAQAIASGTPANAEILQPPTGARSGISNTPSEAIQRFFQLASPTAQRLAGLLAAAPLTLPIMRLIQHVMLPKSTTAHLAEVLVSGMLTQRTAEPRNAELADFDFLPGVRDLLLENTDRYDVLRVLTEVSRYVTDRLGQPLDFPALLVDPNTSQVPELSTGTLPIARITATVLRTLGARYANLADRLDRAAHMAAERRLAEDGRAQQPPDAAEQVEPLGVTDETASTPLPIDLVRDASEQSIIDDANELNDEIDPVLEENPGESARRNIRRDRVANSDNNRPNWDQFDSNWHFQHNFDSMRDSDRQILELTSEFFATHATRTAAPRYGLDVGPGTNLYPTLAMLRFCRSITLWEWSAANIAWLQQEIRSFRPSWDLFWARLAGSSRDRINANARRRLGQSAVVARGSIFDLPQARWDMGTMFFVAESITSDYDEFRTATRCFIQSLKPGSPFAAAFMEESLDYWVGSDRYPAVPVTIDDIQDCLSDACSDVTITRISSESGIRASRSDAALLALGLAR